jgi:hypothetical protein
MSWLNVHGVGLVGITWSWINIGLPVPTCETSRSELWQSVDLVRGVLTGIHRTNT